ncbi:hypothetical protein [Frankia sp. Cas4]|uniref:hypothetical protein n=1 Tax=Frankia sp. Cas4 TaxID=3073927 RepID=UPI002AD3E7F2|nr:hypothetical protein [Frankia sp. Cas4]
MPKHSPPAPTSSSPQAGSTVLPDGTVSHPDDPAELEAAAIGVQVALHATPLPDDEEGPPAAT